MGGAYEAIAAAGLDDRREGAEVEEIDVESLRRRLEATVRGEVRFDAGHRAAYAHDSSNYRQPPLGVVCPLDSDDVVAAVAAAREYGAPVLPRGCGTSLAGEACNVALVVDTSRHMREVLEVDPEARTARVEPGAVRDDLARACERQHGLTFGPDTSTHAWATLGGMIGNNSCGVHSLTAGRTSDNVEALEVLLYDGTRMTVGVGEEERLDEIVAAGGRKGEIYARLRTLRDRYGDLVRQRFPRIPRRVSGYNLDDLLPERGFNVARALAGTEGTCATILAATVRLVPRSAHRTLLVLGYESIYSAAGAVSELLEHRPSGLEAIDDRVVEQIAASGLHATDAALLPEGSSYLFVELDGDSAEESDERARKCLAAAQRGEDGRPVGHLLEADPGTTRRLWALREGGVGAASYAPGGAARWPGWEDAAVPPGREGAYLRDFRALLDRFDYDAAIYGHFGQGCVHCRISFDLESAVGVRTWRRFLDEAADLVVSYGGSLSGEHGDGQARAELLPKMFGSELVGAFREFKAIWDPAGRMNPGKVVDPYPIASNLRLSAARDGVPPSTPDLPTHFSFPDDGGSLKRAARRCVGAGNCREVGTGTMCPSYMATREEEHSTRGRARILFEMLEGGAVGGGFRSEAVHEALDLCLACKGCKRECPVSVDMATYKAEFLSGHFKGRLRPRAAYAMGLVMLHARVAAGAPRLANRLLDGRGTGALARWAGGISPDRRLPPLARESFAAWWRRRRAGDDREGDPVVLFPDTFGNYFRPGPLKAAVRVLEDAGLRVLVPRQALCCARPLYAYGMLPTAKLLAGRTLTALRRPLRAGCPIVTVEPSCAAAFRDELPDLLGDDEDAHRLAAQTVTLAELVERVSRWTPPRIGGTALVHGHCHQEAVLGMDAERSLYDRAGLDFEVLDSGCCGMAGSFGFEREHHDLSVRIAEQRLLPRVRQAPRGALVVADGFSCRTQIEQLTGRPTVHTAELLASALPATAAASNP